MQAIFQQGALLQRTGQSYSNGFIYFERDQFVFIKLFCFEYLNQKQFYSTSCFCLLSLLSYACAAHYAQWRLWVDLVRDTAGHMQLQLLLCRWYP